MVEFFLARIIRSIRVKLLDCLMNVVTMLVSRRTRILQCLDIEMVDWWRMSRGLRQVEAS